MREEVGKENGEWKNKDADAWEGHLRLCSQVKCYKVDDYCQLYSPAVNVKSPFVQSVWFALTELIVVAVTSKVTVTPSLWMAVALP